MTSKIVFFPGFLGAAGGGATRSACMQAAGLAERGFRVLVVGLIGQDNQALPVNPRLAGCDALAYPATRHDDGARSLSLLRDLDDVVRTSDLVHINGAYDRLNHRVSSACELAGVPYIVSPRSLLDPAALDVLPGGVRADLAADERRYLESAFAVHFTTAFEADRACLDGARLRRTVTIPNAVDLGQLDHLPLRQQARAVVGIPAQQCALLYLGRLIAQKQPEFAVRARRDGSGARRPPVHGPVERRDGPRTAAGRRGGPPCRRSSALHRARGGRARLLARRRRHAAAALLGREFLARARRDGRRRSARDRVTARRRA